MKTSDSDLWLQSCGTLNFLQFLWNNMVKWAVSITNFNSTKYKFLKSVKRSKGTIFIGEVMSKQNICYSHVSQPFLFSKWLSNVCTAQTTKMECSALRLKTTLNWKPKQVALACRSCCHCTWYLHDLDLRLLTSGSMHAKHLPCTVCLPTLMLITQAILTAKYGHGHTEKVKYATDHPT